MSGHLVWTFFVRQEEKYHLELKERAHQEIAMTLVSPVINNIVNHKCVVGYDVLYYSEFKNL